MNARIRSCVASSLLIALAALAPAAPVSAAGWERLSEGDRVEVDCDLVGGTLVAQKIDVRPGRGSGVELTAPLDDVSSGSLRLAGVTIDLPEGTRVKTEAGEPLSIDDLRPGEWVEVDADRLRGRLTARRVKRLAAPKRHIELDGSVDRTDGDEDLLFVSGIALDASDRPAVRGLPVHVPRVIDDDDVESSFVHAFDGALLVGGRLVGSVEPERNFDLNGTRAGDLTTSDWAVELQADAEFSPKLSGFVKTGYSAQRILHDDEHDEIDRADLRLQQAWLLWRPARPVAVQFGRQDFDEDREWLYDEILDGVRVYAEGAGLRTELSVSTRLNTTSGTLEDWTNYVALAGREVARNWTVEAYGIHRRHDARDASPLWTGARSHGRLRGGLKHWLEVASLTGRLDGVDKSAWAVDGGLSLRLERRTRWSVTGGLAVGSGGDGPEGTFRQTGFHDNNDRFSGVSSFRYYGELLDPELANLAVATLGTGLRPSRHSSVDIVLHRYAQRRAEARVLDSNLERRPRGTDADLGTEWDVILAFEEIPGLDIEYVLARFTPGPAFDSAADAATLHKLSIRYGF